MNDPNHHNDGKDHLILLLHEQLSLMQQERETTHMILIDQGSMIIKQQQHLTHQSELLKQKDQTIHSQGEQLLQSNTLIR